MNNESSPTERDTWERKNWRFLYKTEKEKKDCPQNTKASWRACHKISLDDG